MPEDVQDPFQLHIDLLGKSTDSLGSEGAPGEGAIELKGRFESGEHQFLGMLGASAACEGRPNGNAALEMLRRLRRPGDGAVLNYGEIVALSGDFYGTPEELFLQKAARFPWWKGTNDLAKLRSAFESELEWIRDENRPG